jgi:hypothetical protein
MLNPGGAAVESGAPAQLGVTTSDCLFAPVAGETGWTGSGLLGSAANARGVVIRVRGDSPDGAELSVPTGHTSAYYSVDPLGTLKETFTFERCKTEAPGIADTGTVALKQRPWSEPVAAESIATDKNPWRAFRLKVDAEAEPGVFVKDARKQWIPIGVAFYNATNNRDRRAYPDWVFSRPKPANEERRKVWFPKAEDADLSPSVQRNLGALLDDLRPGEVIYIRHNGELKRDTIELKPQTKPSDGEFKVTFRADDGYHPVITILDDAQRDQTLFKLMSGEVTFEGVHFQLKPDQPKAGQTVAAVALLGGKSCTFRDCIFTLAEEDDSKVAAVHLPDIGLVMAMTPAARQTPKVTFDRCLIRGKGRGIWAQVSRPLNLEMTNTITAIDGPVLLAEAGDKAASGSSTAKFTHVTALAGGPMVEMHGGKTSDAMRPGGLTALKVDADECLYVAVEGAGRPLVELDGVDPTEWKSVLTWQVARGNRYAGFDPAALLAVIRPGGEGMAKEWTRDDWINNLGEAPGADRRFGTVTFTAPPTGLKELAAVKPADMVPKMIDFADLPGAKSLSVGADPTELKEKLPPLPTEPKPE